MRAFTNSLPIFRDVRCVRSLPAYPSEREYAGLIAERKGSKRKEATERGWKRVGESKKTSTGESGHASYKICRTTILAASRCWDT